jgi:hypothetical protein
MGNSPLKKLNKVTSEQSDVYPVTVETRGCHYCQKDVNQTMSYVYCSGCSHNMHRKCFLVANNIRYSICPRCSIIGSILNVNGNDNC